jgi:hypothetical protein
LDHVGGSSASDDGGARDQGGKRDAEQLEAAGPRHHADLLHAVNGLPTLPKIWARMAGLMYFPAGIPLIALVALVIWNARQEAERARGGGGQPSNQPKG